MSEADLLERARTKIGTVIRDKYTIDGVLGVGGMAVVYKVTHRNRAEFALKMLHPELSVHSDVRARFLREGYAANSVKHPGSVLVVDDDVAEDGAAFLVMELLEGRTAQQLAADWGGRIPLDMTLAIAVQLLDVLAAAHDKGIVHRDIKPANLFVTRDGTLKVLDFGIARVRDAMGGAAGGLSTAVGAYVGTPAFMAPEQAGHKTTKIDGQTDVWAVGATMFNVLTGRLVHDGESVSQMLVKAATSPAPALGKVAPTVPPPIAEVVDRALAFEKSDRWPSVTAMREALLAAVHASGLPAPSKSTLSDQPVRGTPASNLVLNELASAPTVAASVTSRSLAGASSTGNPEDAPRRTRSRGRLVLVVGLGAIAVAAAAVVAISRRPAAPTSLPAPPSASAPIADAGKQRMVPVLVFPFQNGTGDPTYDGTVEAILSSALRRSTKLDPAAGAKLRQMATASDPQHPAVDQSFAARFAASRGGTAVVVQGAVSPGSEGYSVSARATDASTGAVLLDRSITASATDFVAAVCSLADEIRRAGQDPVAPGDAASPGNTGLSTYVNAVHEWDVGQALNVLGKYVDAVPHFQRAVDIDADFAQGRAGLALCLWNDAKRAEADQQYRLAFKFVDKMGERDRLHFLGDYYGTVGDLDRAIDAYQKLLERWPEDLSASVNLPVTYSQAGDDKRALEYGRRAAETFPRHPLARANMMSFLLRTDAFEDTLREGERIKADFPQPSALVPAYVALAHLLLGHSRQAIDGWTALREKGEPQIAATGLADVALYEGRLHDAVSLLEAEAKFAHQEQATTDEQAAWAYLAEARLRLGDTAGALAAAGKAAQSEEVRVQAMAASVFMDARHPERAAPITARLSASLVADDRAVGQRLAGEALRARGKPREAVLALQESLRTRESWLAHYALGRAYLDLGAFPEAYAELQTCVQHEGDAADFWMPSAHLVPPAFYYLGRAQESVGNPDAARTYAQYLAMVAPAQDDPLAADAARRSRRSP